MQQHSPLAAHPLVSAVIPTRGRPGFLVGAVRSALRQTWSPLEVVVVVDGPDPETESCLQSMTDPRLRVVLLPERCGGSEARNAGVRAAGGEWIAFLDDDDEWLPEKIERQMRALQTMSDWFPVISCRVIEQSPTSSRILPPQPYQSPQPIADFLFCRKNLVDPGGFMQCSTLLASRQLLLAIPFRTGLPMHQDFDWLIRVSSHLGVSFHMLPQPLTLFRVAGDRPSVGRTPDWHGSLSWIRQCRGLLSPRAFSWFIAVQCAWRAEASHAGLRARLRLLRAFLFEGKPEWLSLLALLHFSCISSRLRKSIRNRVWQYQGRSESAPGLQLVFVRKMAPTVLRKTSL